MAYMSLPKYKARLMGVRADGSYNLSLFLMLMFVSIEINMEGVVSSRSEGSPRGIEFYIG